MAKRVPKVKRVVRRTPDESLLLALQAFEENDLTRTILVPLFSKLGFDKVEFNGGTTEIGRDLIAWKSDPFGDVELHVAQVKKVAPTGRATGESSWSGLLNQLNQALNNTVAYLNGKDYLPKAVYFITPFSTNQRAIQSDPGTFKQLAERNVKIIDGPRLAGLLRAHLPNMVQQLVGTGEKIAQAIEPTLTNEALLRAMTIDKTVDLPQTYTDLDLIIGRVNTKVLIHARLSPQKLKVTVAEPDFLKLIAASRQLHNAFSAWPLGIDRLAVDAMLEAAKQKHRLVSSLSLRSDQILAEFPLVESYPKASQQRAAEFYALCEKLLERQPCALQATTFRRAKRSIRLNAQSLPRRVPIGGSRNFKPVVAAEELLSCVGQLQKLCKDDLTGSSSILQFEIAIDGEIVAKVIEDARSSIRQEINHLNSGRATASKLKVLLVKCDQIFEALNPILEEPYIAASIGVGDKKLFVDNRDDFRLRVPIHLAFDTGLNLAVLGDAGSGKTTSLQMYAHDCLRTPGDPLVLFIPLVRLIAALPSSEWIENSENFGVLLHKGVCTYLNKLGIDITEAQLANEYRTRKSVVMFDGVDEAISSAPWILSGIRQYAQQFSTVHVIISSRMFVEYLQQLPFIGITLLPYTLEQRCDYVARFFRSDPEKATAVLDHFKANQEIAEIATNPLLATVLCVLADRGVNLPHSEIRLFEERMKLFLGQYDIHKGARRIKSDRSLLQNLAQKIALWLHQRRARHLTLEELDSFVDELAPPNISTDKIRFAISELIDPCSILYPMTADGKLGFGHLRFQEYLAALEIKEDRCIEVMPLLKDPWWRDCLCLYAQMSSNLSFLIQYLDKVLSSRDARRTIELMIAVRPVKERIVLQKALRQRDRWIERVRLGLSSSSKYGNEEDESDGE